MARLILIAGGSSSGKTTISKAIAESLNGLTVSLISMDDYYKDVSNLSANEIDTYNFDHPDAIDMKLLKSDICKVINNNEISIPSYDFISHKSIPNSKTVPKSDVILVEGIFALYYDPLIDIADLSLFVDAEADIRLARRLLRDLNERGDNTKAVLNKYLNNVKQMHESFIEPTKKKADIIIPGESSFDVALDLINGYLIKRVIDNEISKCNDRE